MEPSFISFLYSQIHLNYTLNFTQSKFKYMPLIILFTFSPTNCSDLRSK
jgi:hypothetical protein